MLRRTEDKVLKGLEDRAVIERVVQLDQLDHIFDEAMRAWERSLEDAVTVRTDAEGAVLERTVKGQSGNPALLARAMDALAAKRTLLGLDAPPEVEHGGEVKVIVEYVNDWRDRTPAGSPVRDRAACPN
jgi:hypothetical protein